MPKLATAAAQPQSGELLSHVRPGSVSGNSLFVLLSPVGAFQRSLSVRISLGSTSASDVTAIRCAISRFPALARVRFAAAGAASLARPAAVLLTASSSVLLGAAA